MPDTSKFRFLHSTFRSGTFISSRDFGTLAVVLLPPFSELVLGVLVTVAAVFAVGVTGDVTVLLGAGVAGAVPGSLGAGVTARGGAGLGVADGAGVGWAI